MILCLDIEAGLFFHTHDGSHRQSVKAMSFPTDGFHTVLPNATKIHSIYYINYPYYRIGKYSNQDAESDVPPNLFPTAPSPNLREVLSCLRNRLPRWKSKGFFRIGADSLRNSNYQSSLIGRSVLFCLYKNSQSYGLSIQIFLFINKAATSYWL